MSRLPKRHIICLVTDRRRLAALAPITLPDFVGAAAHAGVDLLQIRERDLDARPLAILVRECLSAIRGTDAKLVVNDRADVALAADADGVHLRHDSIDGVRIRDLAPEGSAFIVGRSIHRAEEATPARTGALDYVILGTMFSTSSKDPSHPLMTMTGLAGACATSDVPVLAIGGMTIERAREVVKAGARGIAAIGMFLPPSGVTASRHLRDVVTDLRRVFDTCGAVS
jgi:thiamine-phosphate pyrophosphorylase